VQGFHQQMHALRGPAARGHLWTMMHLVLQMSIIAVGVSNYLFVSSTFRPELGDVVHVSVVGALSRLLILSSFQITTPERVLYCAAHAGTFFALGMLGNQTSTMRTRG
jgi:hypothetical protein